MVSNFIIEYRWTNNDHTFLFMPLTNNEFKFKDILKVKMSFNEKEQKHNDVAYNFYFNLNYYGDSKQSKEWQELL